uniref:Uncharacterized protein n=1 Tax=virus sp. ctQiC1 TaxID=2825817 RepID=A0A8S5RM35_9VIRU|nr:MAG TPA: hypothetical protein [virus sp. ctQiC1]
MKHWRLPSAVGVESTGYIFTVAKVQKFFFRCKWGHIRELVGSRPPLTDIFLTMWQVATSKLLRRFIVF